MAADQGAPASVEERFLRDFHDRLPGGSTLAFAGTPVDDDAGQRHADTYSALVQRLQDGTTPDGPVLDLCCGDGHLLALLRATGRAVVGVDASAGELAAAQARLGDGVPLLHARAQALPLAAGSLAAVTCHMALMLLDDIDTVLAGMRRLLQPGGRLLAVLPGRRVAADAALAAYLTALNAPSDRHPDWQDARFAATRRDAAGWQALLQQHIGTVRLTPLHGTQRLTPAAAWQWYTGMYDLHLRPAAAWPAIEAAFHAALSPQLDADGRTTLHHSYFLIDAALPRLPTP